MSILGGVLGAVGGFMNAKQSRKDAQRSADRATFSPFDSQGLFGSADITFDRDNPGRNNIRMGLNPNSNQLFQSLQQGAQQGASQFPHAANELSSLFGPAFMAQGGGAIPGLFQNQIMNSMQLLDETGPQTLQNLQGIGNQAGMFAGSGLSRMFGGPSAQGLSNFAGSQGASLLGTPGAQSFNDVSAERLRLLRESARPTEERAVNSRMQQLFNTGNLGSTGGSIQMGELAQAQEQSDIQRQLEAQGFAEQLRGRDMQDVLSRMEMGSGLLGQAMSGVGMDQNFAGTQGQVGAGMFSQLPGIQQNIFGNSALMDQQSLSRGMNRMQSAQQLFGFGDTSSGAAFQRALQALGAGQSMEQNLRAQVALGLEGGAQAASAGSNAGALAMQGAGSPFGASLAGLGQSLSGEGGGGAGIDSFIAGLFGG